MIQSSSYFYEKKEKHSAIEKEDFSLSISISSKFGLLNLKEGACTVRLIMIG
jgi:hypothetical protein